jgi:chemotaxis signal transduction protein
VTDAFDFRTALARLEATSRAIEDGAGLSQDRVRQILEERARLWARAPATEAAASVTPLVVFEVAGQRCGVEPQHVREVLRGCVPTPLPGARPYLSGVIHHRGDVLAVLDLATWIVPGAVPAREPKAPIVVVEARGRIFGIQTDSIPEVEAAGAEPVAPPATVAGTLPATIRRSARGVLMALDLDALADDPRITVNEAAR